MSQGAFVHGSLLLGKNSFTTALKYLLLSLLLLIPYNAYSGQAAEIRTVEASGVAVVSSNAALARDAALNDALRKAVEQAVGTIVSSDTLVENYQVLRDSVYTRTQGYVKGYEVVNEAQSQGLYHVSVRADVAVGPLKDDLSAMGLLQRKAERPRVLFMMAEKNIGHKYFVFWWWGKSEYKGETVDMSAAESTLKEAFLNGGFNVVDAAPSIEGVSVSDAFRVSDLTGDGARKIGQKLNAEIVVYGKAVASEGPRTPESAIGVYLADTTAQAVRVDDGVVLASAKGHGVSRHISGITGGAEAISKASAEMGGRLIEQMTAGLSGAGSVTLRIKGIADYKSLAELKDRLRGRVRGVQAVYQRSFEGGAAVLELESKVAAQAIADELSGIGLSVTNATSNTIEAEMDAASR